MIEDITSSKAMMETLKTSTDTEGSAITDFTKNIDDDDKTTLENRINAADISAEDKEILSKLFGIA